MKLGWRNPHPSHNNFAGVALQDLERKLTIPHFRLSREADVNVAASTYVVVWDTVVNDPYGMWDSSTGIKVPTDHKAWWLRGTITSVFTPGATGDRRVLTARVNGTDVTGNTIHPTTTATPIRLSAPFELEVAASDVITGSHINANATNDSVTQVVIAGSLWPIT